MVRYIGIRLAEAMAFTALALAFFMLLGATAQAGGYCTATQSCRAEVAARVDAQNQRVQGAPRWSLSRASCHRAGREQRANERRCRSYDRQQGGKTLAQCAKCYRQAVFDAARWKLCHSRDWAPPVPGAIYRSIARLGGQAKRLSR